MPTLRLFAGLKESAGQSRIQIPGQSVGEVLEAAIQQFGSDFEQGMAAANVWVNGEPAEAATAVTSDDEIALLPPVSGGAAIVRDASVESQFHVFLALAVFGVLLIANFLDDTGRWFVTAVVGVFGLWVWDVFEQGRLFTDDRTESGSSTGFGFEGAAGFSAWPALAGALIGPLAAYRWGSSGLGVGVAFVVMLAFVAAIGRAENRTIERLSGTVLAGAIAASSAGALVLVRIGEAGQARTMAFLLMIGLANLAFGATLAGASESWLDPHTAAALATIIVGVALAFITAEDNPLAMIIAACMVAGAFLAGRTLGSLLRRGDLFLLSKLPGRFVHVDGGILAAALYWMALALLA